eukprot:TRINITY_DN123011_c0_g1_i1.p1 TRINITY_DN123011_c0_g1~~TRINITY_DN123011_c0_g1_i1.p1  ORF type:complete len:337 (-),score=59.80 TRINITY_DN123011_c0_g1_i1:384-1394(-)
MAPARRRIRLGGVAVCAALVALKSRSFVQPGLRHDIRNPAGNEGSFRGQTLRSATADVATQERTGQQATEVKQPSKLEEDLASFTPPPPKDGDYIDILCRGTNAFFEQLVIPQIREKVRLKPAGTAGSGIVDKLTAAPESPGISRPLWLVMVGSIPTALLWYGYYKFSVEEELFQAELRTDGRVTGCGGYGTLFPFVFGFLFGVIAQVAGYSDLGSALISAASIWILAGQVNLYRRVNEICAAQPGVSDGKPVLWEWWALLPPPIDLIVGLRQVHFLARAQAAERGETWEKDAVAEEYFPFISSPRFTLKEFARSPRMWFWFTKDVKDLDLPGLRD